MNYFIKHIKPSLLGSLFITECFQIYHTDGRNTIFHGVYTSEEDAKIICNYKNSISEKGISEKAKSARKDRK